LQRMKLLMDQQRRFVADAAHELRTPITALGLQAENLDSVDLPESARERVAALKEGMARTKHLLEQLLALARHEAAPSGEAVVVPLDRIVKDVVADVLPEAARKGTDLGFELIEPIATPGEPVMIATMVRNLIDNAVRFTPAERCLPESASARKVEAGSATTRRSIPLSSPLCGLTPWRRRASKS